ncbi:hypothetical protein [Pelosinus propionicus]|nr:hypothetical protein [Pelosinus propionicus]
MGLLLLILLLLSATAFAAPNWVSVDKDESGMTTYVDLNSISSYNGNPNIIRFVVMEKNPTNLYSMLMSIEKNQWTYLEFGVFSYPGEKLTGWEKQNLSWSNYDKEWPIPKVVLSNLNSKSTVSAPQTDDGINNSGNLIYNGPLTGNGWRMENPETGVNTPVQKVVISGITSSEMDYSGDAWIHVKTDNGAFVEVNVLSKQHGDSQYNTYRTYQLRLRYRGIEAAYDLPTKYGLINSALTKVPGHVEVSLRGHTITANLIVNGAIVSNIETIDDGVNSLSGLVSSMGASGNLKIYK